MRSNARNARGQSAATVWSSPSPTPSPRSPSRSLDEHRSHHHRQRPALSRADSLHKVTYSPSATPSPSTPPSPSAFPPSPSQVPPPQACHSVHHQRPAVMRVHSQGQLSPTNPPSPSPSPSPSAAALDPVPLPPRAQSSLVSSSITASHASAASLLSSVDSLHSSSALRPARLSPLTVHNPGLDAEDGGDDADDPGRDLDHLHDNRHHVVREGDSAGDRYSGPMGRDISTESFFDPTAATAASGAPVDIQRGTHAASAGVDSHSPAELPSYRIVRETKRGRPRMRSRTNSRSRSRSSSRLGRRNTGQEQEHQSSGLIRVAPPRPGTSLAVLLRPSAVYPPGYTPAAAPGTRRPASPPGGQVSADHPLPSLLNRIFGLPNHSNLAAYLRISASAASSASALLTSFFSCPAGELRLRGGLPPRTRALCAFAASTAASSAYWTGVIPAMPSGLTGASAASPRSFALVRAAGSSVAPLDEKNVYSPPPRPTTPFGGSPLNTLPSFRQRSSVDSPDLLIGSAVDSGAEDVCSESIGLAESVHIATELAAAMSRLPHTCTPQLVAKAQSVLGERRAEAVMTVASAMGFFNTWVDLVDVSIDIESFRFLEANVAQIGAISLGKHYDGGAIVSAMNEEERNGGRRNSVSSIGVSFSKPLRALSMLRSPGGAVGRRQVGLVTRNIPVDAFGQREAFQDTCGFYFYWLHGVKDKATLRSFLGIIDVVLLSDRESLSRALKCIMCMVLARAAGNDILTSQFAYLAWRFGATEEALALADEVIPGGNKPYPSVYTSVEACGILLAQCMKEGRFSICEADVRRLRASMTQQAIAECVTCLSAFRMIQRWTAANPSRKLEPVVLAFAVSDAGRRLKLPVPTAL